VPEGLEQARDAFAKELSPQIAPRDQAGRFVATEDKPQPMFATRSLEGDPLTGDTSDGGDNERLREIEQEVADGRLDERQGRRAAQDVQNLRRTPADDRHEPTETEQGDELLDDEPVDETPAEDDGEKYEVTVEGETQHVSLVEALRGYIRQETFHKRLQQINQEKTGVDAEAQRLRQNWQHLIKARQDYEQDMQAMIPAEPNWDQEFARDPGAAHNHQKIFAALYSKLAQSRQQRAQYEAFNAQEEARRVERYAVDGFSKFVMDNKIPDEATLQKELKSMRRTAAAAGFTEYEVATVYDPRMLTVLRKASKYDRMTAATRPRAVIPGKGRTLTPGAATPLSGNATRKGLDDALRRQASSGSLDATTEVFRRLL
jgi:hypothetical protein